AGRQDEGAVQERLAGGGRAGGARGGEGEALPVPVAELAGGEVEVGRRRRGGGGAEKHGQGPAHGRSSPGAWRSGAQVWGTLPPSSNGVQAGAGGDEVPGGERRLAARRLPVGL